MKKSENGNVLFYILIAVALLAALIYAVSQSGRGSVQQVNEEKSKLLANEIMDYGNAIGTAFAQLRLRGCKLEQMSFAHTGTTAYDNPEAPVDKTCNIFELAGGGITFKNPPIEAFEAGSVGYNKFSIENEIDQVGSTCGADACTDMVMYSGPLLKTVCLQINNKLGIANPLDDAPQVSGDTGGASAYTGDVQNEETIGEEPTGTAIAGKTAGCFYETDNDHYYFYKVLASR